MSAVGAIEVRDPLFRDVLIGRRLDERYEILSLLGSGAVGKVYRARQLIVDREVAVKVAAAPDDGEAVRSFMQEARAASALHHPNVVTVHDFARTREGLLYLVMELVDGTTLTQLISRGPMEPSRAGSIAAQLCAGLQEAHRHGVVHRDLKPDNIMLCRAEGIGDLVKILDFGFAFQVTQAVPEREGWSFMSGTPAYMSPEQAGGLGGVGQHSDVYALGVILFEMLTGKLPFTSRNIADILLAHVHKPAPRLSQVLARDWPQGLETLVARCLAKDPSARPTSAEVRVELEQVFKKGAAEPPKLNPRAQVSVFVADESFRGEWVVGSLVAQRFRLQEVRRRGGCELAVAQDLAQAEKKTAVLRRVTAPSPEARNAAEVALERWFGLLAHYDHAGLAAHLSHVWDHEVLLLASDRPPEASLAQRVGAMEPAEALAWVRDLCVPLEALHGLRLLHHDLRPQTVRLLDGRPVLADAGLWALVDAGLPLLLPEEVALAQTYKAPEQLGLIDSRVGPETDLYAVGVLLYEVLADRNPYQGLTGAALFEAKLSAIDTGPLVARGVPPAVVRLVETLLEPQLVRRYRTVRALAHDLDRLLTSDDSAVAGDLGLRRLDLEGRVHGREFPLARLSAAAEGIFRGRGQILVLQGPAGMGKTRLMQETTHLVRQRGGWVCSFKARPGDVTAPFLGLRGVLGELTLRLEQAPDEVRNALLERLRSSVGPTGVLLKSFASFIEAAFADLPPLPDVVEQENSRNRLMSAVSALLLAIGTARAPLCLVFDDLQWLDDATRTALEFVAPVVAQAPLLIVVTVRGDAEAQRVSETLRTLEQAGAERLLLQGLAPSAVESFLEERLGRIAGIEDLAQALTNLSGGNPATLLVLLERAVREGALRAEPKRAEAPWVVVPERLRVLAPAESVVEEMKRRLEGLPVRFLRPLALAAVWGRALDVGQLEAMLPNTARPELIEILVEADRAGILRSLRRGAGLFDFTHDAVREAALHLLGPEDRQQAHRRAAELMLAEPEGTPDRLQRVAAHLLAADPRPEDVDWLLAAAEAALLAFSPAGAVRLAEAALKRWSGGGPKDLSARLVIGKGLTLTGQPDDARAVYEPILATEAPRELMLEALRQLAHTHFVCGLHKESVETADRALALLGYQAPRTRLGAKLHTVWRLIQEVILRPKADGQGFELRSGRDTDRWTSELLTAKTYAMFFLRAPQTVYTLLDALHFGRRSGAPAAYVRALGQAGGVAISGAGQVKVGRRLIAAANAVAQQASEQHAKTYARTMQMLADGAAGYFAAVESSQAATGSEVLRIRESWLEALYAAFSFEVMKEEGRVSEAAALAVHQARLLGLGQTREWSMTWARQFGAWALAHCGRPDLARLAVARALEGGPARRDGVVRGYLLAQKVTAESVAEDWPNVLLTTEGYLKHLDSVEPALRHVATNLTDLARAIAQATFALDGAPEALRLLEQVEARARPILRRFPVYELHWRLLGARLALARGQTRTSRARLKAAQKALSRPGREPSVIAAEVLELASRLEGGAAIPRGRQLLLAAMQELQRADRFHPLRQRIARQLDQDPATEDEAASVAQTLCGPLGIPYTIPSFNADRLSRMAAAQLEQTLELLERLNRRMGSPAPELLPDLLQEVMRHGQAQRAILLHQQGQTFETVAESGTGGHEDQAEAEAAAAGALPALESVHGGRRWLAVRDGDWALLAVRANEDPFGEGLARGLLRALPVLTAAARMNSNP